MVLIKKKGYRCQEFDKGVECGFILLCKISGTGEKVNFLYLCLFVVQVKHFKFLVYLLSTLVKFMKYQNFLKHDPRSLFIILGRVLPVKYAQN